MLPNVKSIADTKMEIVYYSNNFNNIKLLLCIAILLAMSICLASVLNFVLIRSAFKLKKSVEVKDQPNAKV